MQYAGASWDELKYIRQAVGFLVRCSRPFGCCPDLEVRPTYCWVTAGSSVVNLVGASMRGGCVILGFGGWASALVSRDPVWGSVEILDGQRVLLGYLD